MSSSRAANRIIVMLCATATAGYIARVNISTAGPLLMGEFGLSQVTMGRIFSAFLLGYALFQVPAGMLADRWGARRVLTVSAWLWVLFALLQSAVGIAPFGASAAAVLTAFIVIRFLFGISESPTYPGSAQGVSKWIDPSRQGRANGIVIASIGLGSAIAPPLISNVMVHWGWRPAILVSAVPALLVAVIWLFIKEPPSRPGFIPGPEQKKAKPQGSNSKSLKSASFILLTASYTLQGYVGYIFVTWFYIYLVQERHFSLLSGAWMSSLPWILSIISIPLGGYISDRLVSGRAGPLWGRRIIPLSGMILSGLMISIGAHTSNGVAAAVALALATALILCVEGPFWAAMITISGSRSGTAGGVMNMGSNIGGMISPALTPVIAAVIGWENALHVAAVLAVFGGLLWLGIRTKTEGSGC
jgi:ACS family glucarate transporter-like MFS transporter